MASSFAIQPQSYSPHKVRYWTVKAAQTFIFGALVVEDTNEIAECGADPAAVLGIALAPASMGLDASGSIWGGSKIPVLLIEPGDVFFMASTTTPAASHLGIAYEIVKSTYWLVDTSATTADTVFVVGISNSPQQEGFYVTFRPDRLSGQSTLT